ATNTRLMAWRLLLGLARAGRNDPRLLGEAARCLTALETRVSAQALVAELSLIQEIALACGRPELARRCRELRTQGRDPVREVLLRNLKTRIGWVEKKVNCDYLVEAARRRLEESRDPGAYFANEVASHFANLLKVSRVEGTRFHAGRCLLRLLPLLTEPQRNDLMVELLRSLELDAEAVTRYIPRFLGSVLASLPEQEFLEGLEDIEVNVAQGSEPLQRLLLQTSCWVLLSLGPGRVQGAVLRRLTGILLGALAESRSATVTEGFAQLAVVLEKLARQPRDDGRLRHFLALATKKLFSLVTHRPGDRVRFFLAASALNHLDRAFARMHPAIHFPEHPAVAFIPGTFDPFTSAHQAIVARALETTSEALVQMDDYSWRKHALPRELREELAWMALASAPEAFLAPFKPPINLASPSGLQHLRHSLGNRKLILVVGSDVVAGASAYADPASPIWEIPHAVIVREGVQTPGWEERTGRFRQGVTVIKAPPQVASVSSTSLRAALDQREDLEAYCHPLVARTLVERRLYVNYPAQKRAVPAPREVVTMVSGAAGAPPGMTGLLRLEAPLRALNPTGKDRKTCILAGAGSGEGALAALVWREVSAATVPVVAGDEGLALLPEGRLVGQGAVVESVAVRDRRSPAGSVSRLVSEVLARWLDRGLLFGLAPAPEGGGGELEEAFRHVGATIHETERSRSGSGGRWAVVRLANPLVLAWDLEGVLQPPYAGAPAVRAALKQGRQAITGFFARLNAGNALLHLEELQLKRRVVAWAQELLAAEPVPRRVLVLGLGRQFSRDVVGESPTLAVDLERYLTWQGNEGGNHPLYGSPPLDLQLAMARELGRKALLLVTILESADAVIEVVAAAERAGVRIREVLIGVTDARVRAVLELRGIPHRCAVVVPGWQGVLRESAVSPYLGGWSITGREPLEPGSLLPSLNDCLPYHYPHQLGIPEGAALDFSRLVLQQGRHLLQTLEETFRATEGRLLSVRDLGAVVRTPRCPPLPEGFAPPPERFPSELLAEDIEALARLHPETHAAHGQGRRGE
ncbi:MAG: hypothetical protein V1750_11250, partial [Acidobacteriota bacterium]